MIASPSLENMTVSETMVVTAMITSVIVERGPIASALGEIALRGPGVAGLLVEPAEPVGDLRLVLARRPLVCFAIGLDRAGQVAVTNPGGRHVAPGRIGRRRLGQLEDGLPCLDRGRLVVEPVVGLAESEQRGRGDRRIVEPDDAREMLAGLGEIARGEELVPAFEKGERRFAGEPATDAGTGHARLRVLLAHGPDCTGAERRGPRVAGPDRPAAVAASRLAVMCGRFTQERPASELAEIFGAEPLVDDPGGHYNVAPTDEALVVVQREERRAVTAYRWGLIPHWASDAKVGSRMFNARAETITSSPAFRDAFVRKRCLVPVDSFYEWKREGTIRQPYRVVERDGRPLALAGLWAGWRDPATDSVRRTFTIITTTPNEALGDLHDRMPVVVAEEAWARWLDPSPADPGELLGLLVPNEAVELDVYAVERFVNDVRRDGPELIVPLGLAASGLDQASAASVQPTEPSESRKAVPGSAPSSSPAANTADHAGEDAVGVGLGCFEHDHVGREAVRDPGRAAARRGSSGRLPSAPPRRRSRRSPHRPVRPRRRRRIRSGSAGRGRRRRDRATGRPAVAGPVDPRCRHRSSASSASDSSGAGGSRGVTRVPSRSSATWPTPPWARSRMTASAVGSSPILPTIWTVRPAPAAASATRAAVPAAAMTPSDSRPMGDPMTTIIS